MSVQAATGHDDHETATSEIRYQLEHLPAGARLSIRSDDAVAVAAIQDFLRYQIREHQTGDSETVPSRQIRRERFRSVLLRVALEGAL